MAEEGAVSVSLNLVPGRHQHVSYVEQSSVRWLQVTACPIRHTKLRTPASVFSSRVRRVLSLKRSNQPPPSRLVANGDVWIPLAAHQPPVQTHIPNGAPSSSCSAQPAASRPAPGVRGRGAMACYPPPHPEPMRPRTHQYRSLQVCQKIFPIVRRLPSITGTAVAHGHAREAAAPTFLIEKRIAEYPPRASGHSGPPVRRGSHQSCS